MGNNYDKFLQRMIQYRERMNLSQKDVGGLFGKTQSQLSKMELGKTIVSFEALESLKNAGWDIDYIITGNERSCQEDKLTDYLNQNAGSTWKELKEVLIWVLGWELGKSDGFLDGETKIEYELLKVVLNQDMSGGILLEIRNMLGFSQIIMAEKLGVNIKKYRDLERGLVDLDAELLVLVYEMSFCRPGIFFCPDSEEMYLLDSLWDRLDDGQQREATEFLDYVITMWKK